MEPETVGKQTATDTRPVHTIPIVDRLPLSRISSGAQLFAFLLLLTLMHISQLFLWPMSLIPGGMREMYWDYIKHSKESFARLMVHISRHTTFVITSDDSINLEKAVQKDENGKFDYLKFSPRAIWISNHQCYLDWIYLWTFYYSSNLHGAVVIILKASLKRVPVAGVAMTLFKFIFLASSWEKDRAHTGDTLYQLGRRANKHNNDLALLIYPEGTLVSPLTRPKSKAFAEKSNIPDMRNTLLPRSTGLLFCLRSLLPNVPDLALYDITVGYPGLPAAGYAQVFYSLASVFLEGHAPPQVHIHLRKLELSEVPFGTDPKGLSPDAADKALTEDERKVFDDWLRARWTEKDELLDTFYKDGHFPSKEGQRMELQKGLKGIDDWLAIFTNIIGTYACYKFTRWVIGRYGHHVWRAGNWVLGKHTY